MSANHFWREYLLFFFCLFSTQSCHKSRLKEWSASCWSSNSKWNFFFFFALWHFPMWSLFEQTAPFGITTLYVGYISRIFKARCFVNSGSNVVASVRLVVGQGFLRNRDKCSVSSDGSEGHAKKKKKKNVCKVRRNSHVSHKNEILEVNFGKKINNKIKKRNRTPYWQRTKCF